MPVVKVKYLASFQALTGRESERVPISEGESLEGLKRKLSLRYGAGFERQLYEYLSIALINGSEISGNPALNDLDEISFATVVGGG